MKFGSAVFAPDQPRLASAGDGTVRLWDLVDPAAPSPAGAVPPGHDGGAPLTGHPGWLQAVAFAPDQPVLAAGGKEGTVRL